jgi:hypothetical protein
LHRHRDAGYRESIPVVVEELAVLPAAEGALAESGVVILEEEP